LTMTPRYSILPTLGPKYMLEPRASTPVKRPPSRLAPSIDTDSDTDSDTDYCQCYACTSNYVYVTPPCARNLSQWLASSRPDMLRLQQRAPRVPLPIVPWVPRPAMPLSHMPLSRSLTNVTLSTKARRNKRRGGRRGAKRKASAAARGDFITVPGSGGEDIQISAPDHFEVGCVIEDLVRQLPELLEEMPNFFDWGRAETADLDGFRLISLPRPPGPCACECCCLALHDPESDMRTCECTHCCAIHMGAAQRLVLQTRHAREIAKDGECSCCTNPIDCDGPPIPLSNMLVPFHVDDDWDDDWDVPDHYEPPEGGWTADYWDDM
jgi:hypothetical protein